MSDPIASDESAFFTQYDARTHLLFGPLLGGVLGALVYRGHFMEEVAPATIGAAVFMWRARKQPAVVVGPRAIRFQRPVGGRRTLPRPEVRGWSLDGTLVAFHLGTGEARPFSLQVLTLEDQARFAEALLRCGYPRVEPSTGELAAIRQARKRAAMRTFAPMAVLTVLMLALWLSVQWWSHR